MMTMLDKMAETAEKPELLGFVTPSPPYEPPLPIFEMTWDPTRGFPHAACRPEARNPGGSPPPGDRNGSLQAGNCSSRSKRSQSSHERFAGVPDPVFWKVMEFYRLGDWRRPCTLPTGATW